MSREPEGAPEASPGAVRLADGRCRFTVWAPFWDRVEVHLIEPRDRMIDLQRDARGVHSAVVDDVPAGSLYLYRLGGERERPDPASRRQPRGVHGPSAVVDPEFAWTDREFRPVSLAETVLYEIHVGTFTDGGTFDAIIPQLDPLRALGVTTIEIMPVSPFPGGRNWGYDGVFPFGVQESYGGPDGLRRLVDACHARGLSVALDVVYNHLGPEGNHLGEYAPYFTDTYHTPWGRAINFDGRGSDEVRSFFIESALWFLRDCHIDVFRLDAIHAIYDASARPFLAQFAAAVRAEAGRLGRRALVIAESDLNDSRVIRAPEAGGHGHDAQWSDDFHHAAHALLTGERGGYYRDFGELDHLARAFGDAFVYDGRYSAYRDRHHGNSTRGCPGEGFVVALQNHDQVGNRARGERLSTLLSFEQQKLAACLLLLSPYVPLLFMGEEYGETAPFLYFTSHTDPALAEAVRRGRRAEFTAFGWKPEEIPDPQDEATFIASRLDRSLAEKPGHRALRLLYGDLLRLRRERPALRALDRESLEVTVRHEDRLLILHRRERRGGDQALALFALGDAPVTLRPPAAPAGWRPLLDSEDRRYEGGGGMMPPHPAGPGAPGLRLAPRSCLLLAPGGEAA